MTITKILTLAMLAASVLAEGEDVANTADATTSAVEAEASTVIEDAVEATVE